MHENTRSYGITQIAYCVYGILALHANFQVAVVNDLWLISMPSNWLGHYYPGEAYWLVEEGDR
jgi:hypothetical protein